MICTLMWTIWQDLDLEKDYFRKHAKRYNYPGNCK